MSVVRRGGCGHLFVVGHHFDSLGRAGPPDPERLYTEDSVAGVYPGLDVLRLDQVEQSRGDVAVSTDLIVWAARAPA